MADLEPRVAVLEQIAKNTADLLARIDARIDRMEHRLDRLEDRMDRQFYWLIGIMLGGFGLSLVGFISLLGVMAHGFKWI